MVMRSALFAAAFAVLVAAAGAGAWLAVRQNETAAPGGAPRNARAVEATEQVVDTAGQVVEATEQVVEAAPRMARAAAEAPPAPRAEPRRAAPDARPAAPAATRRPAPAAPPARPQPPPERPAAAAPDAARAAPAPAAPTRAAETRERADEPAAPAAPPPARPGGLPRIEGWARADASDAAGGAPPADGAPASAADAAASSAAGSAGSRGAGAARDGADLDPAARERAPWPAPDPELDADASPGLEAADDAPSAWAARELILEADSVIGLQVDDFVTTDTAEVEDDVRARVTRDVLVAGDVAVPAGAQALGSVTLVERAGRLKGASRLGVRFHTLVLDDGLEVAVVTETIYREGSGSGKEGAARMSSGAIGGAILGAIFGGRRGAAIGGAAGAGSGAVTALATEGEPATLPAGSTLTVRLSRPAAVPAPPRQGAGAADQWCAGE